MLCSYGCNQEAKIQLKNKKWCCSDSCNKCPEMRKKNSLSNKDKGHTCWYKEKNLPAPMTGKSWIHKGKKLSEIVGIKKSIQIRNRISQEQTGLSTGRGLTLEKELDRKRKISETMLKNKRCGGYRQGSGIGKRGWYNGIWCDSSYELAWVIYNLEHQISFERNTKKFEYIFEGKLFHYIPDFKLQDGSYIELKGFRSKRTEAKIDQFKEPIQILYFEDLKDIFQYVTNKYGKDFIKLYN